MARGDGGAVLILVLIFVIVMSISVLGLLTFGGTGITNATNLQGQRSLEYGADGATTSAIQAVRYSYDAFNNPQPTGCLPDGATLALPDTTPSITINNVAFMVECIAGLPSTIPQYTRVITFYACVLQSSCSASNAIIAATVDFEDVSQTDLDECAAPVTSGAPFNTTTCGTGETISSWVVETADN
jgi:hypothetical protein